MGTWTGQEHDEQWLAQMKALHEQGRDVGIILIVLLLAVVIVIAGSISGVGT